MVPSRLATRLALALAVVVFLALGFYGHLTLRRQQRLFEVDMTRDSRALARVLAAAFANLARHEGEERASQLFDHLDSEEPRLRIRWVPLDSPASSALPAEVRQAAEAGRELVVVDAEGPVRYLHVYAPLRFWDGRRGVVEVAEGMQERDDYLRATTFRLLALATGILILATAGAGLVGSRMVGRPVSALVAKARRIGAGDLSGPLETTSRDELGELAREMNEMCVLLDQARQRILREEESRKQAESHLRHAERLATVGRLAAGVAHEIGTPLNVISGRASLVEKGRVPPEEVPEAARIVREQAHRITEIVQQLLGFARRREPKRVRLRLDRLVRDSLPLLDGFRRKKQVELRLEPGPEVEVLAEPGPIQQVITNLVLNAIQAIADGGTVRLRVGLDPETGGADLEVEDDGPGIPDDVLPRIFEPFFTTKEVGEGTGLGLSVVWGIVEDHGGTVEVRTEAGHGTVFRVRLPPVPEDAGPGASGARELDASPVRGAPAPAGGGQP